MEAEAFLRETHGVDRETIDEIRGSTGVKSFLMSVQRPETEGYGICLASKSWLEFCGLGEEEVLWQNPGKLLQGPLTSASHVRAMGSYFGEQLRVHESGDDEAQLRELVLDGLVNYRWCNGGGPHKDSIRSCQPQE